MLTSKSLEHCLNASLSGLGYDAFELDSLSTSVLLFRRGVVVVVVVVVVVLLLFLYPRRLSIDSTDALRGQVKVKGTTDDPVVVDDSDESIPASRESTVSGLETESDQSDPSDPSS